MSEFDAGMGTTPDMWQMLSELVDGEKLPESLNKAIYALCDGKATVMLDASLHYQIQLKHIPYGEIGEFLRDDTTARAVVLAMIEES